MSNIKTGDILNFGYTGAVQSVTLPKGTYKLECWGAQGGNSNQSNGTYGNGGKGGYSTGILNVSTNTTIYITVGGQGQNGALNTRTAGGFNGGGDGYGTNNSGVGGGGGGASDISLMHPVFSQSSYFINKIRDTNSLLSRIIVAGGGGSAGYDVSNNAANGGAGGGTTGQDGLSNRVYHGTGGKQTTFGTGGSSEESNRYSVQAKFGCGASASNSTDVAPGGGGGWYGGGLHCDSAGGGSGYVYTSSTASNYPSGCLLNSSYYLTDAKTIAGNNSFVSPTGSSETGHSGNGYCRITVIKCKSTALYTRINNSMKKAIAFYFKLNNNKMYGVGSANFNGTVMNFDYTGSVQTATLAPGTYKLECWGAQGGNCYWSSVERPGSLGGYSSGILKITSKTNLFCYVGGAGERRTIVSMGGGGFNGGGHAYSYTSSNPSGAGGGGSDIRIGTDSLYSRVIVAGGGGGAGYDNSGNYGYGGGTVGGTQTVNSNSERQANGGSQTNGGINKSGYTTSGAFGVGGNGTQQWTSGGGGGWYGGAGCYCDYAGGGSGYVYTSSTAKNYPSGCLLNSSYYLSNAQTIAGNQSFPSPTGDTETGHSGNGYVRITKLTDIIYLTHANNDIMDFNYTGSTQSKTLKPGTYTIECWGGQGGSYNSYIGGYGGYSKGTITLTKATTVYISVGGAGSSSSTAAGFNGGGTGISSGRGGGGATDVRIGQNSLYSRVIVAGGGGGAGVTSANANPCGCGGGEYGGDGYYNNTTGSYTTGQNRSGGSASQTAGGITWNTGAQATFGQGGNASGYSCGGGGGGWYGGGGAYDSDSDSDGRWGGGGSGYVYTSSTAKNYPNGCLLNSTYYLTNAQTIAGNTSFTSPTGSAETGHTGNGFCRITNLNPTQYGLYVKTNSGWKHIDL
ncbi:MAG: glycine rich protein [Bacteriophage sp.]|nr:MAG: glycine rich protein [Bacteriophage sp.]